MTLCSTVLLIWPSLVTADEPLKCNAERDTAKRMECLEKKLETLQKEATSNLGSNGQHDVRPKPIRHAAFVPEPISI